MIWNSIDFVFFYRTGVQEGGREQSRANLNSIPCQRKINFSVLWGEFYQKKKKIVKNTSIEIKVTRISSFSPSDFRLRQIFFDATKCNYRRKETCINEITIFREGESAETGETRVRYYLFEEYWIADPGKYHFFRRKLNLTFLACPFILMGQRSILVASNCRATNPNRSHVYTQKGITRNYNAASGAVPPVALDLNHLEYKN